MKKRVSLCLLVGTGPVYLRLDSPAESRNFVDRPPRYTQRSIWFMLFSRFILHSSTRTYSFSWLRRESREDLGPLDVHRGGAGERANKPKTFFFHLFIFSSFFFYISTTKALGREMITLGVYRPVIFIEDTAQLLRMIQVCFTPPTITFLF